MSNEIIENGRVIGVVEEPPKRTLSGLMRSMRIGFLLLSTRPLRSRPETTRGDQRPAVTRTMDNAADIQKIPRDWEGNDEMRVQGEPIKSFHSFEDDSREIDFSGMRGNEVGYALPEPNNGKVFVFPGEQIACDHGRYTELHGTENDPVHLDPRPPKDLSEAEVVRFRELLKQRGVDESD